jgi:glycosyltransferase involved in cell wall biosynthesis
MDITIAICTYNRCEELTVTLENLQARINKKEPVEILVIDNNSQDDTAGIVLQHIKRKHLNIRYIFEKNQGLNISRNRAIIESQSEIIAFIDDDVTISESWVSAIQSAFSDTTLLVCGGPILPMWANGAAPAWHSTVLDPFYSLIPINQTENEFRGNRHPFGANMSFRRRFLSYNFQFCPDLDRCGSTSLLSGGDTELFIRAKKNKIKLGYNKDVIVYHRIPMSRMTRSWIRQRCYWQGVTRAILSLKYKEKAKKRQDLTEILTILLLLPTVIFLYIMRSNRYYEACHCAIQSKIGYLNASFRRHI